MGGHDHAISGQWSAVDGQRHPVRRRAGRCAGGGHHADRDPDRHHDPRRRPGLAGDLVPDRAPAAPRRGAVLPLGVPARDGGRPTPSRAGCSAASRSVYADLLNYNINLTATTLWYARPRTCRPLQPADPGHARTTAATRSRRSDATAGANVPWSTQATGGGPGLPFAYDPLWRYQTVSTANGTPGYYLGDTVSRPGSAPGSAFIRPDPRTTATARPARTACSGSPTSTGPTSRSTTVVPIMPASLFVPSIFVSQEDVVWQEPNAMQHLHGRRQLERPDTSPSPRPSPVIPDLSIVAARAAAVARLALLLDVHRPAEPTPATRRRFDGNIVIFENRPFGIQPPSTCRTRRDAPADLPGRRRDRRRGDLRLQRQRHRRPADHGRRATATGADRTVLLRWPTTMPDPVVKVGDWIADVTYERQPGRRLSAVASTADQSHRRAASRTRPTTASGTTCRPSAASGTRSRRSCRPATDPDARPIIARWLSTSTRSLQARTRPDRATARRSCINAALIAPNVVNVIPQTIFVALVIGH